jgi:putative membrane protein
MRRERESMMSYQQWCDRPVRGQAYKGLLAGLLGGLVACWAMNQWLALRQRVVEGETATRRAQPVVGQGGQLSQEGPDERQPPTMHAAAALAHRLFLYVPTDSEKQRVGQALHYTFGTATSALYGSLAEAFPVLTTAAGIPFGMVVWLLADEIAVPVLGLSKPPAQQKRSTHLYAFTAHCLYGLTTECTRRLVRRYW